MLTTGKDVRKHTIEINPERSLTAIIESDPNTGTLLVQTNEEGAAIVVLIPNGKDVKRGNSKKGPFRVSSLKAGKYLVRAVKEGYDVDFAEQQAEVVKGEDKTVSFLFRPRPQSASVRVRLTPGSELFVDGSSLGTIPEDNRTVPGLKAGTHNFKAQKGRQFQPRPEVDRSRCRSNQRTRLAIGDCVAGSGGNQQKASRQQSHLHSRRRLLSP